MSDCSEAFTSELSRGHLSLSGSSELGVAHGINHFLTTLKSGYFESFIKDSEPAFKMRPLWLKGRRWVAIDRSLFVQVPMALLDASLTKQLAMDLISMGYNALVIGPQKPSSDRGLAIEEPDLLDIESLREAIKILKDFQLEVIIKPVWVRATSKEVIQERLKKIESLGARVLIEKNIHSFKSEGRDRNTSYENCFLDIKFFEQTLENPWVYYITSSTEAGSKKVALLLRELMDEVHPKTTLSFNLLEESAYTIAGPIHPFFSTLLQIPYPSSTQFLPIYNGGCLKRGEGFWPIDPLASLHEGLELMQKQQFAGIINLSPSMPKPGNLLHYYLWMVAQQLWNPSSGEKEKQAWSSQFTDSTPISYFISTLLKQMGVIIEDINRFSEGTIFSTWSFQSLRSWCDSILFQSQAAYQRLGEEMHQSPFANLLYQIWPLFEGDLRRQIISVFTKRQMPLPNIQITDSQRLSYWYAFESQSIPGAEYTLLGEPYRPENEILADVFDAVRYIT